MTGDGSPACRVGAVPMLPAIVLSDRASLEDAAQAMLRSRVPAVLVGSRGSILTEHDLVRALARGDSPRASVAAFASPDPITIDQGATALQAIERMLRHGHRVLLVLGRGIPVGFVSLTDACGALLADVEVPPWLTGLQVALRVEMPGPLARRPTHGGADGPGGPRSLVG